MSKTPFSKLSEKLSPVIRKLSDINIELLGRDTQVLKITKGDTPDMYGVTSDVYSSEILNNVIIKYPLSEVEMFDSTHDNTSDVDSISLMDILPIEVMVRYQDSGGVDTDVVGLEPADIIVDILRDEHDNKIPIRMEIKRIQGEFFGRDMVKRLYQATLTRGSYTSEVESLITDYINNFE